MNKYSAFDSSKEAVAWRRENKKLLRPHVCKLPGPFSWLRPVLWAVVVGAMIALAL